MLKCISQQFSIWTCTKFEYNVVYDLKWSLVNFADQSFVLGVCACAHRKLCVLFIICSFSSCTVMVLMLQYNTQEIPLAFIFGLKPHRRWLSPTSVTSTSTPTVTATLLTEGVQSKQVEVEKHLRADAAGQWSVNQCRHPTPPWSMHHQPHSALYFSWHDINSNPRRL